MRGLLMNKDPLWWCKIIGLDPEHHEKVKTLAKWAGYFVRRSLKNDRSGGTMLMLEGPTGTGKTTVGRFCKRAFNDYSLDVALGGLGAWSLHRKPSAGFVSWSKFCRSDDNEKKYQLQDLLENEVLIIDDVGSESDRYKSGEHKSMLRDFLESCEFKWLLISMNIPKKDWLDVFGARVADRLDAAKRFDTAGIPSYRKKLSMEGRS